MTALDRATRLFLSFGCDPAQADELARDMVACLKVLAREAARQEQMDADQRKEAGECRQHSPRPS